MALHLVAFVARGSEVALTASTTTRASYLMIQRAGTERMIYRAHEEHRLFAVEAKTVLFIKKSAMDLSRVHGTPKRNGNGALAQTAYKVGVVIAVDNRVHCCDVVLCARLCDR
jgi:hypothetical protein